MLRRRNTIPLDYSLCCMTVTVYSPRGERRVLRGVHYEFTQRQNTAMSMEEGSVEFLLVIPGADAIAPGHKVVLGEGPEGLPWEALNSAAIPTLGVVQTVKPRYFNGRLCHTEARG